MVQSFLSFPMAQAFLPMLFSVQVDRCTAKNGWATAVSGSVLSTLKRRSALFQKCFGAFAHVFCGAAETKKRRFQEQAFFLGHFHAALDQFHAVFHRKWGFLDDFFGHCFGGGKQLSGLVE